MLTALLTLLMMAVAGVIAIGLVMAILGLALSVTFGLVGFLLFKVAPLLLIGWVILKIVNASNGSRERSRISAADQRWLDS